MTPFRRSALTGSARPAGPAPAHRRSPGRGARSQPAAGEAKGRRMRASGRLALAASLLLAGALPAGAQDVRPSAGLAPPSEAGADATALAKKLQNPIGDLTSIPFQSNTNLRTGPNRGTQEILNIQPVIPIHVNQDWNVITRTILPLVWPPAGTPGAPGFGTGNTVFSAFLSPRNPVNGWLWGVGPVVQIPTASDATLGSSVWGGGPTGVLVWMQGPWVAGALVNNIWSMGGTSGPRGTRYNTMTLQPFVNYNFGHGLYVASSPIITANWLASGSNAWTLPVGAAVGQVVKLGGKLPVNVSLGAYYNALRPDYGPTWQIRTQVTLIF